ncbi:MAG: GNAT family N-acetyltransferase [Desulfobacteraceae bacterium]|jgi:ribosomal protein S18 acetylase RimI-like enzyme
MLKFREIEKADLSSIFVVRVSTRENAYTMKELEELGITEESVASMLETTHCGWLCETDNQIVGFAMGNRKNGEMWVIAVIPEYEKIGIGAKLLNRVEDWLWAEGWNEIWLTTDVNTLLRAYGFYKKQGWIDKGVTDGVRYLIKKNPNNTI